MIKEIYIVLGGEDLKKRPRSKKLLESLRKKKDIDWSEIRIIPSGRGSFKYDVEKTEAQGMKEYLQSQQPIPDSSIILEDEAMDTLGNMFFSFKIVNDLFEK